MFIYTTVWCFLLALDPPEARYLSIHILVTCMLQMVAFLMKFSDQSETKQAGSEEASNTRMSSWLMNESSTPEAGLGPGSGSGTLRVKLAWQSQRTESNAQSRLPEPRKRKRILHRGEISCGEKQVHVKVCWLS